ncbi:MAG: tRNA preQ1(34) S-adenosylmethionine ribosyltransferase-isomerase QueA [Desulfofustis sp.]|nr:tRNA preQ1(34) S-adenosylmethionine ribosyltransferase-isomerase QueA [Desulfofustis sp.]NNK55739.1 tRNA preQ1(34) S-adenosylmethionine ribosyltransferase-isomerase QueA [Desulfofustis sp.]
MQDDLKLAAYHYDLPEKNIAQFPADKRDHSRLLALNRRTGVIEHLHFHQITGLFNPGDLLVLNDTRVFPARLHGRKESGGRVEVFLLGYPVSVGLAAADSRSTHFRCEALIKSSRPPKEGSVIQITPQGSCVMLEDRARGRWLVELIANPPASLESLLDASGEVPLPPYIKREAGSADSDRQRYQTVYANQPGAIAAPTAGLHFTKDLIAKLEAEGVRTAPVTLHVGYGTFAPVQENDISKHRIHREYIEISESTVEMVNKTKDAGAKIWAVGTTTVRALESSVDQDQRLLPVRDWCDLYITPGFTFRVIDNLITNFHLPESSLLFLVAALCGRETLLASYREAIARDYRFYSYGDAMVIID